MHPTTSAVTLAVAVFLASAVESVEALTIIVAAGVSRGWRSALEGMAVAIAVLAVLVAATGPALVYLVPIDVLRTVVGTLLLVFGLQWLRKAVLRAVGLKAKHDEDAIFKEHVDALGGTTGAVAKKTGRDPAGFAVAFKTVVGLMLVSFGTFWAGEGLGVRWPGSDLAILVLVGVYAVVTLALVQLLRAAPRPAREAASA
jgi:uncharacterized membrane protein